MKAIQVQQFGGPEVLRLIETPVPTPAPGQVLIKLHAIGVNPVDALCRSGQASWVSAPFVPGFDAAGVVVQADHAGRWHVGDRVYVALSMGSYAEYLACEADALYPLPAHASFALGAALGIPYFTAFGAVFRRATLQTGETLLVRGASGAVGMAAVQLARAQGFRVLGTAGSEEGLARLREHGVEAFDHRRTEVNADVLAAAGGLGVNVILEVRSANLGDDLGLLAPQGRVVLIGDRSKVSIDPEALTSRSLSILGFNVGGSMNPAGYATANEAIQAGLREGTIQPRIAASFPLGEAARAHELLGSAGLNGKIVLLP